MSWFVGYPDVLLLCAMMFFFVTLCNFCRSSVPSKESDKWKTSLWLLQKDRLLSKGKKRKLSLHSLQIKKLGLKISLITPYTRFDSHSTHTPDQRRNPRKEKWLEKCVKLLHWRDWTEVQRWQTELFASLEEVQNSSASRWVQTVYFFRFGVESWNI